MKDRYDLNPGKEAAIANVRQGRLQKQHQDKDNFVKKEQAAVQKYAGKKPIMKADMFMFNANMQNNGAWAQEFGKKLTVNIDKVAFPVNGQGDDS